MEAAELMRYLGEHGIDLSTLPEKLRELILGAVLADAGLDGNPDIRAALGLGVVERDLPATAHVTAIDDLDLVSDPELLPRRDEPAIYRLRVDLDDVRPPIWRRLDLPSDLSLDRLHLVLQAAMGWWDSHLHAFRMASTVPGREIAPFLTTYDLEEGDEGIAERDVRLDEVLNTPGQMLRYEYDFGDGWQHTLQLEKVLPSGRPGCRAGRRACPPEDCGGTQGYKEILAVLAGKGAGADPEASAQLLGWLPRGWSPDSFDRAWVDEAVRIVVAGGIPGLPPLDELDPALSDLIGQAVGTLAEPRLAALTAAVLGAADCGGRWRPYRRGGAAPDGETVRTAMRPLQALLGAVGSGVDVVPGGGLPSSVVAEVGARCDDGVKRWWAAGSGSGEELVAPVADLQSAAQRLGLLRRRGGQLLPTAAARRMGDDPEQLWLHVTGRLPVGTVRQKAPGTLLLLATAGGGAPVDFTSASTSILAAVGWHGGQFTHEQYAAALIPTWSVLQALGCFERSSEAESTDVGVQLARAALCRA